MREFCSPVIEGEYEMQTSCMIGIDIGGTNFRIGAVKKGETTANFLRKLRVEEVLRTDQPLKDMIAYLKEYCEVLGRGNLQPQAVSIGFPATLDKERKVVLQAPNVRFMENLPVAEVLTEALGMPVVIERDVSMALFYDRIKYQLPECEVLIGCYFGTGIGNAICIRGELLGGKNGTAGELGHIPVDGSTKLCGCGNRGCMENLAGGKYLSYLCQRRYRQTRVRNLFKEHGEEPLLRQFVERMAMTVATEINILNPDYVIIGGGVPNMRDFPLEYLEERIHFHARKPYPECDLNLIFAEDEEDKSVVGAAVYAAKKLKL